MIIRKDHVPVDRETDESTQKYGASESLQYSDAGGLTQFGAYVHTLQPGSRSSDRHWHEEEDEFLYMLSGEATVIEDDGPHLLEPGDAACWRGERPSGPEPFWRAMLLPHLRHPDGAGRRSLPRSGAGSARRGREMAAAACRRRLPDQRWGDRTASPHDVAWARGRPVALPPAVSLRCLLARSAVLATAYYS